MLKTLGGEAVAEEIIDHLKDRYVVGSIRNALTKLQEAGFVCRKDRGVWGIPMAGKVDAMS